MKKLIIASSLIALSYTSFGQANLGTRNAQDLIFTTNSVDVGIWTKEGPFQIGGTTVPFDITTFPKPSFINLFDQYAGGSIYQYNGTFFESSIYGYKSTEYLADSKAFIQLIDPTNDTLEGGMTIQGHRFPGNEPNGNRPVFMQRYGGRVSIGTTITNNGHDILQTSGTIQALGYVSAIRSVSLTADVTLTNADGTVVVTGNSGIYKIILPTSTTPVTGITPGRIFVVKNIMSAKTQRIEPVSGTIDGAAYLDINNPNESAILQFDGTNYYRIN